MNYEAAIEIYCDLTDLVVDQAQWSQATFGTDRERGPIGALKHLEKEAREAYQAIETGGDLEEELADCFLLLLDATRRSGRKFHALVKAAQKKMEVNKLRKWPTPPDSTTPVEHVKSCERPEGGGA